MLHTVVVLAVSIAPALAFLVLILALDRREPEPAALILKTVGLGAAAAVPAALVELLLGGMPIFALPGFAGAALTAFVQVAPVEEACKLAPVMALAWRRPAFNEENDGIVYTGAAAIGFAAVENILYVARFGLGAGAARAFTAIPLHVFTGVLMGLQVGRARLAAAPAARRRFLLAGFTLAWVFHGAYDMFAMSESALALLLLPLLAGLAAFGIIALRTGRRLSIARWEASPAVAAQPAAEAAPPEAPAGTAVAAAPAGTAVEPAATVPAVAPASVPRAAPRLRWMPVVSRLLLGASALFWALLVMGILAADQDSDRGSAALGGILLTSVPIGIGVALEVAWAKRRAQVRFAATSSRHHA